MPTFRAYKQQRPTRGLYDTITFYHPSFGYVRLVDKQFFAKTLGGQTYTPARFEIEESQQSGTPVIDATVKLGRLSSDIKALMKQWKGAARLTAITATRRYSTAAMCRCRLSRGSYTSRPSISMPTPRLSPCL